VSIIKLEAGKRYVMRNGKITGPLHYMAPADKDSYPFDDDFGGSWLESGRVWRNGTEYEYDIVAELNGETDSCSEHSQRAGNVSDPIDPIIKELCEQHGYGAVMDSAQRQWQLKDPIGCLTIGPCLGMLPTSVRSGPIKFKGDVTCL
jgi:hypothetical protein